MQCGGSRCGRSRGRTGKTTNFIICWTIDDGTLAVSNIQHSGLPIQTKQGIIAYCIASNGWVFRLLLIYQVHTWQISVQCHLGMFLLTTQTLLSEHDKPTKPAYRVATAASQKREKMTLLLRSFLRSPALSRTSIILRRPHILAPGAVGGCSKAALATRRYHVCWKLQYRLYVFCFCFCFCSSSSFSFFFSFLLFLLISFPSQLTRREHTD